MKRWHQLRGAGLCKVVKSRHEEGVNFNKNLVDVNWERFCKASNIIWLLKMQYLMNKVWDEVDFVTYR